MFPQLYGSAILPSSIPLRTDTTLCIYWKYLSEALNTKMKNRVSLRSSKVGVLWQPLSMPRIDKLELNECMPLFEMQHKLRWWLFHAHFFAFKPLSMRGNNTFFPACTAVDGYGNPQNVGKHNSLSYCMTQQCVRKVCIIRKFDFISMFAMLHFAFPTYSLTVWHAEKVAKR